MQTPCKILLVDDDEDIRDTLSELLSCFDYEVVTARDGADALARMDESPHVILLDLMMPVMDGYEFFTALRARPEYNEVAVFVLTAWPTYDTTKMTPEAYFRKPLDLSELLKTLEEHC